MVGQTVSHYRIIERLGGGGMGVVFEAEDLRRGHRVAVKFLSADLAGNAVALERFRREARAISILSHPHICTLHDIGEADGRPFFVMELLVGESLQHRMRRKAIGWREAARLAAQLADALDAAHARGIIHRDLKPGNVFVTEHGAAKLLDFGIATEAAAGVVAGETRSRRARVASTVGTAAYMSPEQVRGDEVDGRSDVYSLGVLLYEMVGGRVPFAGRRVMSVLSAHLTERPRPLREVAPASPEWLEAVVARALAKAPADRFQTMGGFQRALEEGLARGAEDDDTAGRLAVPDPGRDARSVRNAPESRSRARIPRSAPEAKRRQP